MNLCTIPASPEREWCTTAWKLGRDRDGGLETPVQLIPIMAQSASNAASVNLTLSIAISATLTIYLGD